MAFRIRIPKPPVIGWKSNGSEPDDFQPQPAAATPASRTARLGRLRRITANTSTHARPGTPPEVIEPKGSPGLDDPPRRGVIASKTARPQHVGVAVLEKGRRQAGRLAADRDADRALDGRNRDGPLREGRRGTGIQRIRQYSGMGRGRPTRVLGGSGRARARRIAGADYRSSFVIAGRVVLI